VNRRGKSERDIPWDALDASSLGAVGRELVGKSWRERAWQEHLAVGAFAILTTELAADGCDNAILERVARAASDEVRHARICQRMADALLGADATPARARGLPNVPRHAEAAPADRVLYHMVEMCCLSETITGVCFTEMLARATDRTAHATLESLLADEIDHGRVGWAYLAARQAEARLGDLPRELPKMLERVFRPLFAAPALPPEADDPALEAFGWLGPRALREQVTESLRDVIVPGFEKLGVDLGPSEAVLGELVGESHAVEASARL
jgi:hypothetical protein